MLYLTAIVNVIWKSHVQIVFHRIDFIEMGSLITLIIQQIKCINAFVRDEFNGSQWMTVFYRFCDFYNYNKRKQNYIVLIQ